jgi:hypothetical protein
MNYLAAVTSAAAEPAGGAAIDQVAIATGSAMLALGGLWRLVMRYRGGGARRLGALVRYSERVSGLPGWTAVPAAACTVALLVALLGMYWDVSLHIDDGRDAGPLANPAHCLILFGLFGVFAAGVLAIAMPRATDPGPAAVTLAPGWRAPVGGLLMASCGAFALAGFPLDDIWHRLFGQDVTLWGPTHLMLIGGAGMTLIGQAVLLQEGLRARAAAAGTPARGSLAATAATPVRGPLAAAGPTDGSLAAAAATPARGSLAAAAGPTDGSLAAAAATPAGGSHAAAAATARSAFARFAGLRHVALMGGLLIGLSTFQAEFDFGVPQFRAVNQPALIALAAGVALVAAGVWIGRGGALGAALFFLAVRGTVALLVGPVFGETTPSLPLYLGEALAVEAAALLIGRRPLLLGAVGGLLAGTVGFATEWGWSHVAMTLPWEPALLPEALVAAAVAGVAGGVLGGLMGAALRGELPRPPVARLTAVAASVALVLVVANGLYEASPAPVRAAMTVTAGGERGEGDVAVRLSPADAVRDAAWLQVTAWQGGGLVVDRLERAPDGAWRTTRPIPLDGDWKVTLRLQRGRAVVGAPIRLPADPAIPVGAVPLPAGDERPLIPDRRLLQRELKGDIPGWLWGGASAVVLALTLGLLATLAWGLGRIARPAGRPAAPPARRFTRTPEGVAV